MNENGIWFIRKPFMFYFDHVYYFFVNYDWMIKVLKSN